MLSAAVTRVKQALGSSASGPKDTAPDDDEEERKGPDLYECEGCGSVFISKPDECSSCGTDDFTNVGQFER
ncbi:hypothetical protein [Halorussus halophilus]|uniref:hypothetical protein n=1 Tax=Halorussus halophilus TaxID=2650975 RepID=UPI00130139EF|nr:hypothetical protein [Halorussus halophilus]